MGVVGGSGSSGSSGNSGSSGSSGSSGGSGSSGSSGSILENKLNCFVMKTKSEKCLERKMKKKITFCRIKT